MYICCSVWHCRTHKYTQRRKYVLQTNKLFLYGSDFRAGSFSTVYFQKILNVLYADRLVLCKFKLFSVAYKLSSTVRGAGLGKHVDGSNFRFASKCRNSRPWNIMTVKKSLRNENCSVCTFVGHNRDFKILSISMRRLFSSSFAGLTYHVEYQSHFWSFLLFW